MSSDEENPNCSKCKCITDEYLTCSTCERIICINCTEKGYYINTIYESITHHIGTCYACLKDKINEIDHLFMSVYEWRILYNKYKTLKETKKSQIDIKIKYITELEAEIKLLKTMIDFQVGGDGYLSTREHFKQLVDKNDTIGDNQYNDCDDDN
jgi:hypothetical protein